MTNVNAVQNKVPGVNPMFKGMPLMGKGGAPVPTPGANPFAPPTKSMVAPKVAPVIKPIAKVVEPVVEEVVEAPVVEQQVMEEVNVNQIAEEVKVEEPVVEEVKVEEVKVEEVKEEAPKAKAKSKSKAKPKAEAKTEEVVSEEQAIVNAIYSIPKTTLTFAEAVRATTIPFADENWEAFKAEMIAASDEIVIESDMQEGAVKKTIASLSNLRDKVWVQFNQSEVLYKQISGKEPEGLIERIKATNYVGSNESERKTNAVKAVMNYTTPEGDKINVYEVHDELRARYIFLKGLMETISYKSNLLITVLGAIKSQKNNF